MPLAIFPILSCFPNYSYFGLVFPFFLCLSLFSHFSSFGLALPFFLFWPCFPIFPILATFSLFFLFRCAMLHRVVCRHFLSVNGPRNRLLLHYKHQTASFILCQKNRRDWWLRTDICPVEYYDVIRHGVNSRQTMLRWSCLLLMKNMLLPPQIPMHVWSSCHLKSEVNQGVKRLGSEGCRQIRSNVFYWEGRYL